MAIIEAALYLDAAELVELLLPVLTPAQRATLTWFVDDAWRPTT